MKPKQFLIGLAVLTLLTLMPALFRANSAPTPEIPSVIRARALELVDDHGRVRAELKVFPAQPALKMPDGTTGYPESVLLRLINSKGGPDIKLTATEDGAGLVIGGESGYVQILSRGTNLPIVKLVAKDGREQVVKLP
ncbi:MAG TPA: hypothetical protein VH597_16145 [Verrucomicrobiae bacterium]|jgi:hypothetical protein|nr:hypothetical protein [Verrucomicrobiae bacterium]